MNWNTIKEKLQGPIGDVITMASASLLALGLILALSGVGTPLGIALIAAGAAGLATATAARWDTIGEGVKNALESVKSAWLGWKEKHPTIAGILDTIFGVESAQAKDFQTNVSVAVEKAKTWVADAWTALSRRRSSGWVRTCPVSGKPLMRLWTSSATNQSD